MSEETTTPEAASATGCRERRWLREATSTGIQAFDWNKQSGETQGKYQQRRQQLRKERNEARMAQLLNRTALAVMGLAVIQLSVSIGLMIGYELDRGRRTLNFGPDGVPGSVLRD